MLAEQNKIVKILQTWDRAIATTEKLIEASKQQKKALMQQLLTGKKRFPGFEGEWERGRVGDLLSGLEAGVSVNSQEVADSESPFRILKTSCVSGEVFNPDEFKPVVDAKEISRLRISVVADTIIISRMNTPALVGANAYVHISCENTYLPDRLWVAKQKEATVNMRWLGFWFSSVRTRNKLSGLATGTSGSMKNISKDAVLGLDILIPKKMEQNRIAQTIAKSENNIVKMQLALASLRKEKKALMQQLLTGKRRVRPDE